MTLLDILNSKGIGPYRKSGSRYVGPCPLCGGSSDTTRFVTKSGSDTGKCFSCGWGGDAISLLRELEGCTCKQAHLQLGRECGKPSCPAYEKCKGIKAPLPNHSGTVSVPPVRAEDRFVPAAPRTPADLWREQASRLVEESHERLLSNREKLSYLAARGIDTGTVTAHRLGWLPGEKGKTCIFRPLAIWGLTREADEGSALWIPRGIVIPTIIGGRVDRIRIRRPNEDLMDAKDPKYIAIKGGGNGLFSLNPEARAQMPVESDLDALLIHSVAGDLVGAIPLTTCTVRPDSTIWPVLERATIILVALDSDPLVSDLRTKKIRSGGPTNALWWQQRFPRTAERWPVPVGKDPGEAWQKGVDLRAWVLAALPISLHHYQVQAQHQKEAPLAAQETTFDSARAERILSDATSRITSGYNGTAWEWLEANRPDVVEYIGRKKAEIDQYFAGENEAGLIKCLEALEEAYRRAWAIHQRECPPVIDRGDYQPALIDIPAAPVPE